MRTVSKTTDLIIEKLKEAGISYDRQSDSRLGGKNHGIFNASTKEDRAQNSELVTEKERRNQMTAEERFKTAVKGGESKQDIALKTSQLFQEIYRNPNLSTNCIVVVTSNNTLEALTAQLNEKKPSEKVKVGYSDVLHLRQSENLQFVQVCKKV